MSTWLYLVPVIFLELGSAFGLVVANGYRSVVTPGVEVVQASMSEGRGHKQDKEVSASAEQSRGAEVMSMCPPIVWGVFPYRMRSSYALATFSIPQ